MSTTDATDHESDQVEILEVLVADHRVASRLFEQFDLQMSLVQREEYFRLLTTTLVQHEVAEEETVYPVLRALGSAESKIADTRIGEQTEAETMLRAMERLDVMDEGFESRFRLLQEAVLTHARLEEEEVFPILGSHASVETRIEMGRRYVAAREHAPTHPHPHSPNRPPADRIFGLVNAASDHIRDAFRADADATGSGVPAITRHD